MAPKKLAIGSKKGGPGKTTVTVRLGEAFVRAGKRVLVIDLDSQANATTLLEVEGENNLFDVLFSGRPGDVLDAIYPSSFRGIDVVPGSASLTRIVTETLVAAEMRLKTAAHGADDELAVYDYILIDLPPAVDRLTLNGLVYADFAVAVAEPTSFGLEGVMRFMETVEDVRSLPHLNPALQLAGIVVNKFDGTNEHRAGVQDLLHAYGDVMLRPYVPLRTAMQQAESRRIPLSTMKTGGSRVLEKTFDQLAKNLVERI